MIVAALVLLVGAVVAFGYRMVVGPTLADRVTGVNGILVSGMAAIVANAARTGSGAFLPSLVAISLVGFVGTGMVARYLEGRGR